MLFNDSVLLNGELNREDIAGWNDAVIKKKKKHAMLSTFLEMIYQTCVAWLTQTNLYPLAYYSYIFLFAFLGGGYKIMLPLFLFSLYLTSFISPCIHSAGLGRIVTILEPVV